MIARWMEKEVENKLHYRRIVYLHGARQTGKTTLVRNIKANRGKDVSLDDQSLRESAILDPLGFLVHKAGTTMVIDEVQKAPLLIEAMKLVVDRNTEKGQFLITGSSDVFSMPEVKENLAGRISTLILRPFAVGEIMGVKPTFLLNAFEGEFPSSPPVALKPDVLQLALKGGYPEAYGLLEKERKLWHLDYINSLLLKDARDDYGIMKSDQLRLLVQRLATWSGRYLNVESMLNEFQISRPTFASYLSILGSMGIVDMLQPFSVDTIPRCGKTPKLFMNDTGLMASLLDWTFDQVADDSVKNGKLVETFVYGQLASLSGVSGVTSMTQFRDRDGREVDMVLSNTEGHHLFVEVKAGSAVNRDDFRHVSWLMEKTKDENAVGLVFYTGLHCLSFGERLFAVPISALWA